MKKVTAVFLTFMVIFALFSLTAVVLIWRNMNWLMCISLLSQLIIMNTIYIEFDFGNGTYKLKNKVKINEIVSIQKGDFWVDDDNHITITNDDIPSQNYLLCPGEEIYFEGNKLIIKGYVLGYGDISMTFQK